MALQDQRRFEAEDEAGAPSRSAKPVGRSCPKVDRSKRIVIRDGHGSDVVDGFDPSRDCLVFEMAEIKTQADVKRRIKDVRGDAVVTFDNGDELTLTGVETSKLSEANLAFGAGPVCLAEGTLMFTERGEVPIEALRPDDIIWTKDHGWQAIRLVTLDKITFQDRDDPTKPILIPEGSLGFACPHSDLVTSPQQRILQMDADTGLEVLVPAIDLVGHKGIRQMRGKRRVHYLGIVMQRHSVLQAAGCWVESVPVTSHTLQQHGKAARRLLEMCKDMKPMRRVEHKGVRPRRLKQV